MRATSRLQTRAGRVESVGGQMLLRCSFSLSSRLAENDIG